MKRRRRTCIRGTDAYSLGNGRRNAVYRCRCGYASGSYCCSIKNDWERHKCGTRRKLFVIVLVDKLPSWRHLNYEVATYMDAQSRLPRVNEPLEFEDGLAYLRKTDILRGLMYFSYDRSSDAGLIPLTAEEVREVISMNRAGEKPESLRAEPEPSAPDFISAVGDDSISRFDAPRKKRSHGRSRKGGRGKGKAPQNQ